MSDPNRPRHLDCGHYIDHATPHCEKCARARANRMSTARRWLGGRDAAVAAEAWLARDPWSPIWDRDPLGAE